jgi:hypothetical protein
LRSSAEKDLCYICTRQWKTVLAHQKQTTEPSSTWAGFPESKPISIPPFGESTTSEAKNVEEDTGSPFSKCRARYESVTEVSLHFQLLIRGKYQNIDIFSILSKPGASRKFQAMLNLNPILKITASTVSSNPPLLSDSTGSADTLGLVQTWIKDCLENHDKCRNLSLQKWRPTRLLKIDSPYPEYISLDVASKESPLAEFEPYMTLSHCWGNSQLMKLTMDTHADLPKGIPLSKLPKTFQDAVCITRFLGCNYIWIDSLCIVQTSKLDWVHESSLMGMVYSNALCNIGAAASSSSDGGCFRERNPILQDDTVSISDSNTYRRIYNRYAVSDHFDGSPLLQRGWVVQERIMSRRFIHFGAEQVFWDCRELFASEVYPRGIPNVVAMKPSGITIKLKIPSFHLVEDSNKKRMHHFWLDIVAHYSGCGITMERDKLVAISGIAKRTKDVLEEEYHAGLWASKLPFDLSWFVRESGKVIPLPASYQAPSWSWASVNAAVIIPYYNYGNYGELALVKEVKITLSSENLTGEVSAGYIRLRGMLKTIVFKQRMSEIDNKTYDSICISGNSTREFSKKTWMSRVRPDCGRLVRKPGEIREIKLHCMPIYEMFELACLLLVPTGKTPGQFRRWGVMFLVEGDPLVDQEKFKMAENYDWLQYEEHHDKDDDWGSGKTTSRMFKVGTYTTYTISII